MGTGPNTQENQAAGGNGSIRVTQICIPRNQKLASRVITQSTKHLYFDFSFIGTLGKYMFKNHWDIDYGLD